MLLRTHHNTAPPNDAKCDRFDAITFLLMSVITTDRGAVWTGDSALSHFDGSLSCLGPGALVVCLGRKANGVELGKYGRRLSSRAGR